MASKSRSRPKPKRKSDSSLAELGIFNLPNFDLNDDDDDSDINEGSLESELEQLLAGNLPSKPRKPKKKAPLAPVDIERLAADVLKDNIDDDDDDNDDTNLSGDEELLAELNTLIPEISSHNEIEIDEKPSINDSSPTVASPSTEASESMVKVIESRINLYKEAINTAKISNDNSRVRRFTRALKVLESLHKSAKSGATIKEEDIPPIVPIPKISPYKESISNIKSDESPVCPLNTTSLVNESEQQLPQTSKISPTSNISEAPTESPIYKQLITRRNQYKAAALHQKKNGNIEKAMEYVKIAKTFDRVIEAQNQGQPIDLTNMPPPPAEYLEMKSLELNEPSNKPSTSHSPDIQSSSTLEAAALAAANEPADPGLFAAPPPPTNILEALQQRLEKFTSTRDSAQAEGNTSKFRRLQRIVKQYENAIKDYKAGKNVDFEELPTPPGFAPIPVASPKKEMSKPVPTPTSTPSPAKLSDNQKSPLDENKPVVKKMEDKPTPPQRKQQKLQRSNTSTQDKQLAFLLERQNLFKQAAISAKKNGDIQQAKEYLRMSKGFESMIEATKGGLPIDASTIPTPPQLESDFVIVDKSECFDNNNIDQVNLFENLEKNLLHQIQICQQNKEHFLRLGDVSSASKFEKLSLESTKDLTVIRHLNKNGNPLPRFHYETRLFSIVQSNTDLGDNDVEVIVERGINLPGKPDDLDSFIRLEFPIPSDNPQRAKTNTVKDTNNPIFQETFKFEINRKSRSHLRQIKRHSLKLEVWSKGGFFRSDTLLGTVNIKLCDLESKCLIHDSFDLMVNRKTCGGKLEVKIRVRDPLLVKQVEEVREKWLVIGS